MGLICALLLLFVTLQHKSITAEIDLLKSYKNTVEELNHTISSLQHDITDLKTDKQQLEDKYNSLNQKILELENKITSLSDELTKAPSKYGLIMTTEAMSWFESRQFCRDHGAHLVIIKSEVKQWFISSFIKENTWIGLSDIDIEGTMEWVDNSPLNQGFWVKGEPNNARGDEDCVELMSTEPVPHNWNDESCTKKRKALCEK